MLQTLLTARHTAAKRDRLVREYLALLRLPSYLIRDTGLDRSEIHARLDALNVPV